MIKLKKTMKIISNQLGFKLVRANNLTEEFHSLRYLRHNMRRLEHLASLRLPVAGMSVLEVGSGIGDHSHYYIDRGCSVTITEARRENLRYLRARYPQNNVQLLDIEKPSSIVGSPFDIVHCYGLLYHLKNPEQALEFLARNTGKMLLLETCVSFGENDGLNQIDEDSTKPTQAFSGTGCRPTRLWVFARLKRLFDHVYIPKTQPNHEEFPISWTNGGEQKGDLHRAIFIASREKLDSDVLLAYLADDQIRHE